MRCPVCRADNATGPQCRRCRADLSLLFALEQERARLLAEGRSAAARGDWPSSAALAARARQLRHGDDAGRLLAAALLMQGEFAAAWRGYVSLTAQPREPEAPARE